MPAPVVQSLDQILADLQPAYSGQEAVIGDQRSAIPAKYAGQEAALGAAKTNAFHDINTGANSKGLAFSGIPAAEQARYVGEKYLPGLTNLKSQQNTEDLSLASMLASLQGEKQKTALSTQQGQQKGLTDYLNQQELLQEQQAFDKWKIQNDQSFTAQQNALNRSASAAQNAGPSAADVRKADVAAIQGELAAVRGSDGRVSPQSYAQMKSLWTNSGYSSKEFDTVFASFRNPNNKNYKLG